MRNRTELAKFFSEKGFKVGAEIGVFKGEFSEILFKNIEGLKLYCVDVWEGAWAHGFVNTIERLKKYNAQIVRKYSVDAVKDIEDESLDFVFIDASHTYENVKQDIELWTPKVRKGGIVSGHDYYVTSTGNSGVIKAVDEFCDKHGYNLKVTVHDRTNPVKDEREPSWYFIK